MREVVACQAERTHPDLVLEVDPGVGVQDAAAVLCLAHDRLVVDDRHA